MYYQGIQGKKVTGLTKKKIQEGGTTSSLICRELSEEQISG
jgi:hypothetical protein